MLIIIYNRINKYLRYLASLKSLVHVSYYKLLAEI